MVKLLGYIVLTLGVIALIVLLSFLMAYPTMWLVNAIFSSTLLTVVFGTTKLSLMKAWALNVLIGGFTYKYDFSKKK